MESAISNLDSAFQKMYKKSAQPPKFHKKGQRDSFRIDGSVIKVDGKTLSLPKKLTLKLAEPLRYKASKIYNVTVSKTAGMWFASIQCEIPESKNQAEGSVGIDLGVKEQAVCSDGKVYDNIHVEKQFRQRIAHAQRSLARKQKGSQNRKKAQTKLSKLYYKAACKRNDNIHKFTADITKNYGTVCLEDLNVSGMVKNHKLAKAISDVAFGEIRRQFEYKANEVLYVNRFAPSSKTCCECRLVHDMPLSKRIMDCECGNKIDRDLNAAINILRWATPIMPVDGTKYRVKQESNQLSYSYR
jgi:putative transposase